MSNLKYLQLVDPETVARVILSIGNEACSFCPKEYERRCDERCAEGLKEWLEKECDPEDDIWKEGF